MSKINAAESIRGLACMAVVLSHLALTFYPGLHYLKPIDNLPVNPYFDDILNSPFTFFYAGSAAVYVFFVLSGFVLSFAILKSGKNVNSKILSMTIKRYPRLAIPAVTSCLIAWSIFRLNFDMSTATAWIGRLDSIDTLNAPITHAFYDGLIADFIFGKSQYNWVLWTMQTELLGSFIVFALIYIKHNFKTIAFSIAVVASLAMSFALSVQLGLGIFCFIIGLLTYFYGFKIKTVLAIPILLLGLYFAGAHNDSLSYSLFYSILGSRTQSVLTVLSGVLIVYPILMNDKFSEILDRKLLVYIGKLSFSLYLLHMIVIYAIGMRIYNTLQLSGYDFWSSSLIASLLVITISIIASIFYSKYIDDLSIKTGQKIENIIMK